MLGGGLTDDKPDGQCDMHKAALLLGLALSLVVRTSGGQVVNTFEPFQSLWKDLKDEMTYIFGKHTKQRFADFKKECDRIKQPIFIARLPNDTRVAGAWNLIKDALRLMFVLAHYGKHNDEFFTKSLSKRQWETLAQFEAIISTCGQLCFTSQSDRVEVAGEMVLSLAMMKETYKNDNVYQVVDVNATEWPASTPLQDLPRVKMAATETAAQKHGIP
jgi:hypothetical protein